MASAHLELPTTKKNKFAILYALEPTKFKMVPIVSVLLISSELMPPVVNAQLVLLTIRQLLSVNQFAGQTKTSTVPHVYVLPTSSELMVLVDSVLLAQFTTDQLWCVIQFAQPTKPLTVPLVCAQLTS